MILWKARPRTQETSRGTLPRSHKHAHHPALDLSAEQADESRGLRHAQPLPRTANYNHEEEDGAEREGEGEAFTGTMAE